MTQLSSNHERKNGFGTRVRQMTEVHGDGSAESRHGRRITVRLHIKRQIWFGIYVSGMIGRQSRMAKKRTGINGNERIRYTAPEPYRLERICCPQHSITDDVCWGSSFFLYDA
ncbi:MAG: hypothetical protein JNL32_00805 [Candidatus Kapabacteria bacterium]|nr:hypothetical protein [Candidatus Kapabacteria bacterium]